MSSLPRAIWRRCQVNDVIIRSTVWRPPTSENRISQRKIRPNAILSTTNITWTGLRSNSGAPVAGIKQKTSSDAPGLFHIEEGGIRILRNVLYYSLFVGWDEADRVAEWIVVCTTCLCMTALTEVFPCFFLSCKANVRVKPAKDGAWPAIFLVVVLFYVFFVLFYAFFCVVIFVLFYVLFGLWRSLYFLCVYVYWTTATGWLPNCS